MPVHQSFSARPMRRAWFALALGWLAIGVLLAVGLYLEREEIEARERQHLAHQARTIEINLGRQLDAVNHVLTTLARDLQGLPEVNPVWLHERLTAFSDAMTGVRTLVWIDAEGTARAASRPELVGRNFAERAYFQAARAALATGNLVVSPPFRTNLGVWAINLARPVPDATGAFAGVVTATLDPEEFAALLDSVRYAPDMLAGLVHGDGLRFLVRAEQPEPAGADLAQPGTVFTQHRASGQAAGVYRGVTQPGGGQRLVALHTIQPPDLRMDKALVAAAGRDWHAIFAVWRSVALGLAAAWVLLGLAAAVALHLLQRRRVEAWQHAQALAAQEAALQARWLDVLQATNQGVWDWDVASGHVYFSPVWHAMLGYANDALEGRLDAWMSRLHAEDAVGARAALQRHLDGAAPFYDSTHRVRCKDGSYRWLHDRGRAIAHDAQGRPVRIIGTSSDVTEATQQALKLRETERVLRHLMNDMPIGLCMVDEAHRIYFRNRRFLEDFGHTEAETPTLHEWTLRTYPEDDYRRVVGRTWKQAMALAAQGGGEIPVRDYRIVAHDGTLRTMAIGGLVFGQHVLATFVDRTEQQAQSEALRKLAYIDGLTGLANRRHFDTTLQAEWRRCRRSGKPLALVMLDIDHFKRYNDRYGHPQGDETLKAVATALRASLARPHDLVARYGGEEFVCLLPECDLASAYHKAQALCRAVQALGLEHKASSVADVVTISAGVACQVPDGESTPEALLAQADAHLYRAKQAGRNRADDGTDVLS